MALLSVAEAEKLVLESAAGFGHEKVSLLDASGRVLSEALVAERDHPPFDRVMMDGFALRADAVSQNRQPLKILGVHPAGRPAPAIQAGDECYEVMTGSVLPRGCERVIPVEVTRREGAQLHWDEAAVASMKSHVQAQASEYQRGETLIRAGTRLEPVHIAVLASEGSGEVRVARRPRVALVSTGDELVDPGLPIESHQIRRSNPYALASLLQAWNLATTELHHFRDDERVLSEGLAKLLEGVDVLMLTGGVSMGLYDLLPQVLGELGVEKIFHKVAQRPGKPLFFGSYRGKVPVFAFPGNAVSSFVGLRRYAIPYLLKGMGHETQVRELELARPVAGKSGFTIFMPVRVEGGRAEPRPLVSSGHFAGLMDSDGFVELPDPDADTKVLGCPYYGWSS